MNAEEQVLVERLKTTVPPVKETELERDLWPLMLARLERRDIRVSLADWVLAGIAGSLLLFFPELIPVLFYHM
jgi:hypothetical protein